MAEDKLKQDVEQTKKTQTPASGKDVAIILIRGQIGARHDVKRTLRLLNLFNKFNCVILKETPQVKGMLEKVKDYVTWGPVSADIIVKVQARRKIKEKTFVLHPPVGGFERKGIKLPYKLGGVLGQRDTMDKILNKML